MEGSRPDAAGNPAAGERIPHGWVGSDVLLARINASAAELVTLRAVNELGLAYAYKDGDTGGEPIFVPWSAVSWMRPPVPGDFEETDPESE